MILINIPYAHEKKCPLQWLGISKVKFVSNCLLLYNFCVGCVFVLKANGKDIMTLTMMLELTISPSQNFCFLHVVKLYYLGNTTLEF